MSKSCQCAFAQASQIKVPNVTLKCVLFCLPQSTQKVLKASLTSRDCTSWVYSAGCPWKTGMGGGYFGGGMNWRYGLGGSSWCGYW